MPKRPKLAAPAFGAWLAELRDGRSFEQIAIKVRPLVDLGVHASLIHKIEKGRVPSWPMLAAFARVYDRSIDEMTARLTVALGYARDLSGHGGTPPSPLEPLGGDHVGTDQARLQQLTGRIAELEMYERIVRDLRPLLGKALTLVGKERADAPAVATGSRGRHRKAD